MENSLYILASKQIALRNEFKVIANNIANQNTDGFKAEKVLFEKYMMDGNYIPGSMDNQLSYIHDRGTFTDNQQGAFIPTERPLDIALFGKGYFVVQTPAGIRYTRGGNFNLNDKGELVTMQGHKVLNEKDRPIYISDNPKKVEFTQAGEIKVDDNVVDKIKVVQFQQEQLVEKLGNSLYMANANAGLIDQPENFKIFQGVLEKSNVNPITEMTNMMQTTRDITSAAQLYNDFHSLQRDAIKLLAEVND